MTASKTADGQRAPETEAGRQTAPDADRKQVDGLDSQGRHWKAPA